MSKKKSILLTFVLLMVGGLTTFATAAPNGDAGKVAQIGDTEYATLADAIAEVEDGGTIKMIANVEKAEGISVPSGKNFTVDFQDHKYAVECPGAGSAGTRTQAFQLLQGSTITFKNGTIECTEANKNKIWEKNSEEKGIAMIIQNYANLTLENMTIDATNIAHNGNNARYAVSNNCGTVEFKGTTTIKAPVAGDFAFDVCKSGTYAEPKVTWNSEGSVTGGIELSGGEFILEHDLEVKQPVKVVAPATLNLGDYTLSAASDFTRETAGVIIVNRKGDLTVKGNANGTIQASQVYAAVLMTEKTVDTGDTTNPAKLTVESGTLIGLHYGIVGNGSTGRGNTEITIKGGTVKGTKENDCAGIYHPQSGSLIISGGTIEGAVGIYVKAGSVTTAVDGGTIKGVGIKDNYSPCTNGFHPTGDAIVFDNCGYPGGQPNATINGGAFISNNGNAVASYATGSYSPISPVINGGTFSDEGAIKYAAKDAKITVKLEAHRTAGTGVFVKADQNQTITFDLNGKTFSANGPAVGSNGTQTQAFHLEKGNTITIKNGTIECTEANKDKTWSSSDASKGIAMIIQNYANLTLENMTIDGTNIAHNGNPGTVRYIISNNSGNVTFKGVTNIIAPDGDYAFDVCKYASYDAPKVTWNSEGSVIGKIELTGGEFVVAKNLALTQPIRTKAAAAKLTVNANITPASGETSWNGGDALVIVNRTGDLTISGSGTISGNQTVSAAVKMTEKTVDEADAIKDKVAKLTVDGTVTLEGDYFGITGNGSRQGTEIIVNGGTIKGVHANDNLGIFHPQDGKLTITGGTIEGYSSAVEVRAGTVNISGGSLESTATTFSCSKNGSGNTTVGAALAIAQHTTRKAIDVTIDGGTFTGYKAISVEDPEDGDPQNVKVVINGGTFSDEGAIKYAAKNAKITVKLGANRTAGTGVFVGADQNQNITFDLNGKTFSANGPAVGSNGTQTQAFHLEKGNTITIKNGTIECTEANKDKTWSSSDASKGIAMIIQNYADLTLDGVTIDATNIAHNGNNARYAVSNNCGTVEFKGNTTIKAPVAGDFAFDVCEYASYDAPKVTWNSEGSVIGKIELTGGEFVVEHDLALTQPIRTKDAAAKLTVKANANITPASGETSWNGGDALVIVNRTGDLTISGSGTISGNQTVSAAVKMTEKTVDEADAIKDKVAKLTVDGDVTLEGDYFGITGNGSRHGTEITVKGGTIKGVHAKDNLGIFHPQDGKLTITGGTIEGYSSAVEMRGGSITVTGGNLTSTATEFSCNPNGSGNTTVGAALAIAQHTTKKDISVQISGGSFTGKKALNESNPQQNDPAPQVTMNVSGGKFKGEISAADVKNFLSGGIYSDEPNTEYLAIGKTVTDNPDATTKSDYPFAVVPRADEVQVSPDLEIAPAEGEQPLTDEEKTKAKKEVSGAIDDMRRNKSAILPDEIKESNTEAVEESVLTTDQSVGINVEFDGVKVKVETASVTLKEFTFDVTPYVVETVGEDENQKSVSVKKIENKDIKNPMTFRLPIPSNGIAADDNSARVIHHKENGEDEYMGLYSITNSSDGKKYIEISTLSFSKFDIELTDVTIPTNLCYYAGNSTKIENAEPNVFLNAKADKPNAIAIVESGSADWAKEQKNVIVKYSVGTSGLDYYECPNLVLTDLSDFYSPVDFIALSGSYTRTNTEGLNSVCLPFAISKADVNSGTIGTFSSTDMIKEDNTIKASGNVYFNHTDNVEAGMPCIVDCESAEDWVINLQGRSIKAEPISSCAIKGSYVEKHLGTGFFKVESSGAKFVSTKDNSDVFQFRAYLDLNSSGSMEASDSEAKIEWNDDSTTGINTIDNGQLTIDNSKAYNLNGVRVNSNYKGIVIINGKKYIK